MPVEKWSDNIWIVKLAGEPDLSDDLVSLQHDTAHANARPSYIIDFSAISQLTSSNLSQLLRLRKQAIDHEAKLRLVGIADLVWVVFMTTGLDKVFEFAPDVPAALAGLQLDESGNR